MIWLGAQFRTLFDSRRGLIPPFEEAASREMGATQKGARRFFLRAQNELTLAALRARRLAVQGVSRRRGCSLPRLLLVCIWTSFDIG